ncbi:TetR/AcrR family transcriptional regulator [Patulibacter sp. NPDC049589]|uniref:TetR/AcrR family transcriptional regulator n=1 Tax=Patulibacter sp. NPDC049589 TaxID=3154731 RepID=UPI0034367559
MSVGERTDVRTPDPVVPGALADPAGRSAAEAGGAGPSSVATVSAPRSTADERLAVLAAPRLPAGHHGLTRQQVAESQRTRIMAALVECVGEIGLGDVGIAQISGRAGVSRRAFYDHFSGKDDACLCACDVETDRLLSALTAAAVGTTGLDVAIRAALDVVLRTFAADPPLGRLLVVEPLRTGRPLLDRRDTRMAELARLLEDAAVAFGGERPRPLVAQALVAATYDAIYQRLAVGSPSTLPELLDDLHRLFVVQLRPADDVPLAARAPLDPADAMLAQYRIVLDRVYAGSRDLLVRAPTWQAALYQAVRACYVQMRSSPDALQTHFITTARDERVQRIRGRHRERLLELLMDVRDDAPERTHAELMLTMIHATMRAHIQARETPPDLDEAEQTFATLLFNTVPED